MFSYRGLLLYFADILCFPIFCREFVNRSFIARCLDFSLPCYSCKIASLLFNKSLSIMIRLPIILNFLIYLLIMKSIKSVKYKGVHDLSYYVLSLENNIDLADANSCLSPYKVLINVY